MKRIFTVSTVRNENDIIESFCRYNLTWCDGMLIRDNGSIDNTKDIIQKLINEGLPIYFTDGKNQTERAHQAIDEYGADLVVPLDADEFLYHTDGINPRDALESMSEDVEYQSLWRTYVYEKEPDIALGFMPNNFTHYRNPILENPRMYERHIKTIASKFLLTNKQVEFVGGSHFLIYPERYSNDVKIEIHDKLVFAHFPIRSKDQLLKKSIPNWITKWAVQSRVSRDILDNFQLGVLFNELKRSGEISHYKIKQYSIEYAMLLDSRIHSGSNIINREDINKIKNALGENLTIKDPMDVSFCSDKLDLHYSDYNEDKNTFIKATLIEIDKTVTYLSTESDEKSERINELTWQYDSLNNEMKYLIAERDNLVIERDALYAERDGLINSRSWRITRPLRSFTAFVRRNKTLYLFAKGIMSLKRKGLKKTIKKIITHTPPVIETAADASINDMKIAPWDRSLQPISSFVDKREKARVNLVTDSIEKHSLLGGVATALIIATEYANRFQIPLRIITRTTAVDPLDYKKIIGLNNIKEPEEVSFYTDYDRDIDGKKNFKLDISEKDIFIATSWWSAAAISKTTITKRFFYVLQEVETFFYPHGDEHYYCSQIMNESNIDYIVNSRYLFDYFQENVSNIVNNGIYFNPAFSKTLYQNKKFVEKSKYNLFFYSRPNNPRNMFYYGINLLNKAIETGILDPGEWNVYLVGQDTPEIIFSNGYKAINKGLLDWEQYASFLSDIDMAVSLMYTPHPSYPPYDAACSGSVVVSNTCLNKKDFPDCKNVILGDLDETSFLQTMEKGIELAKDIKQRKKNYEESTIPKSWQDTLKDVLAFMEEKSKDVLS